MNQINSLSSCYRPLLSLTASVSFWHTAHCFTSITCSLYWYHLHLQFFSPLHLLIFPKRNSVEGMHSCHSASGFVCQCGGGTTVSDPHHPHVVWKWHWLAQKQTALCRRKKFDLLKWIFNFRHIADINHLILCHRNWLSSMLGFGSPYREIFHK